MSQLHGADGLTFSHHPSQPSPGVPSASLMGSDQSRATDSRTTSQVILNNKLIPRNHLGLKHSPTPRQPGTSAETVIANTTHPEQQRQTSQRSAEHQNRFTPTPTTASGKDTPESDILGYDDLKIQRTRSLESAESPPSSKRHTPKPDSPTLHLDNNPLQVSMPRDSSIDSAISNGSNLLGSKSNSERGDLSPAAVRNLIATAGSAEKFVTHLLKEKSSVAAQNAQLWKLVEKQRALLLGLNKDLDRITKERDRYKRKAKEQQAPNTSQAQNKPADQNLSPSADVKQSHLQVAGQSQARSKNPTRFQDLKSPMDPAMMPQPLHSKDGSRGRGRSKSRGVSRNSDDHSPDSKNAHRPMLQRNGTDSSADSQPSFSMTVATPVREQPIKPAQSSRKAPPKPLNLGQSRDGLGVYQQSSATSELTSFEEEPERGRRRTREDDDREREFSAMKAGETRSRSLQEGRSSAKPPPARANTTPIEHKAQETTTMSPPGLPLSPRPQHAQVLMSPGLQPAATLGERMMAGVVKSPGLPVSPRPMHNTTNFANSLPLSPRANAAAMPLSPRAPKQALPHPTDPTAPVDSTALQSNLRKMPSGTQPNGRRLEVDRLQTHLPPGSDPPQVYRGLVVANHPNLLLPPNALPSILVRVVSSRLKSSRNSVLGLRGQEDSTVFSLSVISRSSSSELWRIEKIPSSLPQLEQLLKPRCAELPKLPDRKLFAGHSPAHADARRKAIDDYFDDLLDIPIDEQAATSICRFLSTDVLDPDSPEPRSKSDGGDSPIKHIAQAIKTGYLTKKGKNFGGWKSRFFVLEGYELRYYESASGSHLGTVKIQNAQIGKQKHDETKEEDADGQFRHAFLVQEPKRRDSSTYIRHVLCAESDAERDEWVKVLIRCSEGNFSDAQAITNKGSIPAVREEFSIKEIKSDSPTPSGSTSNRESPAQEHAAREGRSPGGGISGPINGSVIKDAAAWGQKNPQPVPLLQNPSKDPKSYKMSNIFSFKKPDAPPSPLPESKPKPRILRHNGYVRPVFGLSLVDAIEFCAPFHIDVDLPAVVYRSVEYLRFRNAADEEGLFRLSGSNSTVRMLKERFNSEGDVDLVAENEYHDVHAVASLFKSYLRELPASILTRELHVDFMKVLELSSQPEKVAAFNGLVRRLPSPNFVLLKEICRYLLEVTQRSDKNKMTVRNMGIVFSPTLNIPPPVFTLFLNEYAPIFEGEVAAKSNVGRSIDISSSQPAPMDVRSPRQQTFTDLATPPPQQTSFPGLPNNPQDRGPETGPGDFGFIPVQPSYESGNYVSHLNAPVNPASVGSSGDAGFSSLNGMLAPANGPAKTPRRESSMIFSTLSSVQAK